MSSILEIGNNKNKCQKFTPDSLVKTMLDLANYKTDLMGKTILENSFGSGNILKEIVVRYIKSGIGNQIHRLDYLLLNMRGLYKKIGDKHPAHEKLMAAIDLLQQKRNVMR